MSPLKKVFVRGPDAAAVLDHLTTRDMTRIAPGQFAYLSVLTEAGTMADDAIVSSNGADEWMIVHGAGDTMAPLEALAAGRDAQIAFTDDLHDVSVQGPKAAPKIRNVGLDIAHDDMLAGGEELSLGGEAVGVVNSPCYSHRLGKSPALANIRPEITVGTALEVKGDGIDATTSATATATVVAMPIYDPTRSRTLS